MCEDDYSQQEVKEKEIQFQQEGEEKEIQCL